MHNETTRLETALGLAGMHTCLFFADIPVFAHTAACPAISAGRNAKAVQPMLDHKSAAMTLDTYSRLFEDDLDAVAHALNAAGAPFMKPSRFRLWEIPMNHQQENPPKHCNCSNF